ncbi:PAS domain-containing protein [Azospirillum sp. B21]|nr:PAS domain-containing protein [Azospirillum sp. B21]
MPVQDAFGNTLRDRFLKGEDLPAGSLDEAVLSSWRRLRDRASTESSRPSAHRTADVLANGLLGSIAATGALILGSIRLILGRDHPVAILLVDGDLIIHSLAGDRSFVEQLEVAGLREGRSAAEDAVGTNAVDLCLRERRPMITSGWQHVCAGLMDVKIAAAPLFGLNNALHGAIALVSDASVGTDTLNGLALLCAESTSAQLSAMETSGNLDRMLVEQRAIIDSISDGLLVVDEDGRVRHMNAPAGRILTLNPEQSVGRRFAELLDFEPIIAPIFRTGVGYYDRELIIDSNRRHLHLIDTAIPVKDAQGKVQSVVNTFREFNRAKRIAQQIAGSPARYTFDDIIGTSDCLRQAIGDARKAALGTANILLNGPSGTGKEVFAQAIHSEAIHAHGDRRDAPFIAVNCAALPRELIESELFGYVAGSFTGAQKGGRPGKFEMASGGTIFLDEITEMPLDLQAKLLRVLQEREVTRIGATRPIPIDVRVIAASNRDLKDAIARREFREDLYYRLHVVSITIPALKDRRSDIPMLATHFLRKYAATAGKPVFTISDTALRAMTAYDWPGNVRELENTLERLVVLSDGTEIRQFDPPGDARMPPPSSMVVPVMKALREHERDVIAATLIHVDHNVTKAAEILGIARPTLYSKIRDYGIVLQRAGADKAS